MKIDYQNNGYDFLLSFYGEKEAYPLIKTAAERGFFRALEENRPLTELKKILSEDETEAELILGVLTECGLVLRGRDYICAAPVAAAYLTDGTFLTAEKHNAFLGERLLSFVGEISGCIGASQSLNALGTALVASSLLSFEEHSAADLFLTDTIPVTMPALSEKGILVFIGSFKEDGSLASAVSAYLSYREQGVSQQLCGDEVFSFCEKQGFVTTPLLTVSDGISVIFAAKDESALRRLTLSDEDRLIARLKKLDICSVTKITPADVVVSSWVRDHCRFGCSSFGDKHCPPHSPNYDETLTKLTDYRSALLIEGVPPTHTFQKLMLKAEKTAFKAGFYRAFAYWAGPCSICTECNPPKPPKKCTATRPSMESAGIDVFATVRKQGFSLETRKDKNEYVKYFGLLLLD